MSEPGLRIAVRVDASRRIGTGHVMRCLALSDALRERGAEIRFICRDLDGHGAAAIRARGHGVQLLPRPAVPGPAANGTVHADWLEVDAATDAVQTRAVLEHWGGIEWLVVDHYALEARWAGAQRVVARRILAIDDLADRPLEADLLLDQNLHAGAERRYGARVPAACRQLLGPRYALLRPEFAAARARARPRTALRRLLVSFGGVDAGNDTARVLRVLQDPAWSDLTIDAVAGSGNAHVATLRACCGTLPAATLHHDVQDIAELMLAADAAVGASGISTWERAALGLPAIIIAQAANQEPIGAGAARAGIAEYLGAAPTVDAFAIGAALTQLRAEPRRLQALSAAALALVDGSGAARVADAMMAP